MLDIESHPTPGRPTAWSFITALALSVAGLLPTVANAIPYVAPPPFGNEVNYLEFTIDHHYSALRMTELAAGTSTVGSSSNFAGAPDVFTATPAKATDPIALDVATMANAGQRREITEAQGFLQTYYGISFMPSLQSIYDPLIATLDQASSGDAFNVVFLETFSGHHATLLPPSQTCISAAPHADVRDYCASIVASQTRQIDGMRTELRDAYGIGNIPYEIVATPGVTVGPDGNPVAVPEPASAALLATGLLGLGLAVRQARRSATT